MDRIFELWKDTHGYVVDAVSVLGTYEPNQVLEYVEQYKMLDENDYFLFGDFLDWVYDGDEDDFGFNERGFGSDNFMERFQEWYLDYRD